MSSLHDLYLERKNRLSPTPLTYPFGSNIIQFKQIAGISKRSTFDPKYQLLYQYIQIHASFFKGKKVLDLYSGLGLVGMLCSLCEAQVTFCEDPKNIPLLQSNLESNKLAPYQLLSSSDLPTHQQKYDYIFIHELELDFNPKQTVSKTVDPYEAIHLQKDHCFQFLSRLSSVQTKVVTTIDPIAEKKYLNNKDVKLFQNFVPKPNPVFLLEGGKITIYEFKS